jgi:hypothetical protein
VYISTRELLGQTADRSTNQEIIERHCGRITGVESLLKDPILGPILNQMGATALSDEALEVQSGYFSCSCHRTAPVELNLRLRWSERFCLFPVAT